MSNITTQLNNTIGTTSSTKSTDTTGTTSKASTDAASLMGTTDQFLNILLAQLKHQDPLEPMKGTEFIDSISRLSGVEQSINTNKYLESMVSLLKGANSQTGNPVSYIDKTVDFNSSQFSLVDGIGNFSYILDEKNPPESVAMVIKDSAGKTVVETYGTHKPGLNTVKWDGTDMSGNQLKTGLYTVSIQHQDPSTIGSSKPEYIEVPTFTTGKVTEADFTGTDPVLKIGGVTVPLTAIRKLYGSSSS